MKTSRRVFLQSTVCTGLSLATAHRHVLGANGDIRMAVIGVGGKGGGHLQAFSRTEGVRMVAACDVDPERLAKKMADKLGRYPHKVAAETDPRKIIERNDVDAIVIATPDHWHALLAVWACQAGKDVYVEKPVSHNVWEGRQITRAAEKYGRIVQAGTQYRSCVGLREAAEYIHNGNLGKPIWGHVLWYERRGGIGLKDPYIPDGLDYDLYCGPAPVNPLRRDELHYDWHWVWSTGTGDLGNSGIHAFDVCRWFAGHEGLPPSAMCVGGRFGVDDAGETPNTQLTILDYESTPIVIENRNLPMSKNVKAMDNFKGVREGLILYCENGYFAGFRGGGWVYDNDGKKIRQFKGDGGKDHRDNFLKAVRSRRQEDLRAPILQGHLSSACCHLGNVSYQMGKPSPADAVKNALGDDERLAEIFGLIREHLAANEVDIEKSPLVMGPRMTIDPESETVTKNDGPGSLKLANSYMRREYRKPYTVPETV